MKKKMIGTGVLALVFFATAGCATRHYGHYGPPPPPRAAAAHGVRAGFVWIPGHYRWVGHRNRWIEGRWVKPPRPGMVWMPGYRERRGGVYIWVEGYWW